jgi:hypothetical protein
MERKTRRSKIEVRLVRHEELANERHRLHALLAHKPHPLWVDLPDVALLLKEVAS